MKITKQISPTEYVVEIDPGEIEQRQSNTHMVINHDCVRFMGTSPLFTKSTDGGISTNFISVPYNITIPIRSFVFGLLPQIVKHEYCQEEHAKTYGSCTHNTTFFENGRKMIALFEQGCKPHIMPYDRYKKLTKLIHNQDMKKKPADKKTITRQELLDIINDLKSKMCVEGYSTLLDWKVNLGFKRYEGE